MLGKHAHDRTRSCSAHHGKLRGVTEAGHDGGNLLRRHLREASVLWRGMEAGLGWLGMEAGLLLVWGWRSITRPPKGTARF